MQVSNKNESGIKGLLKSKIVVILASVILLITIAVLVLATIFMRNNRMAAANDFTGDLPTDLDEVFNSEITNEGVSISAEEQEEIDAVLEDINNETDDMADEKPNVVNIDMTNVVENAKSFPISTDDKERNTRKIEGTNSEPQVEITTSVEESTKAASEDSYNDTKPFIEEIKEVAKLKNVSINSFIIDSKVATRSNPTLITLVTKSESEVVYIKVKMFARLLNASNEPITRTLVFNMPKIYAINGQAQTQFYWAGRTFMSSDYVKSGRYIIYAEVEAYDKNNERIGVAGRYSMPKLENAITLK